MDVVASRFDVFLVSLDPTQGSEIRMTRPCVVISPDVMNKHLRTLIVAPMTTKGQPYPSRVPCTFEGKKGMVVLDQIRTVDRVRLVQRLGKLSAAQSKNLLTLLQEMFAD